MRAAAASEHSGRSEAAAAGYSSPSAAPASVGSTTACGTQASGGGQAWRAGRLKEPVLPHAERCSTANPHPASLPHARTCSVEMARPAVLTGSQEPSSSLHSSGTVAPAHSTPPARQGWTRYGAGLVRAAARAAHVCGGAQRRQHAHAADACSSRLRTRGQHHTERHVGARQRACHRRRAAAGGAAHQAQPQRIDGRQGKGAAGQQRQRRRQQQLQRQAVQQAGGRAQCAPEVLLARCGQRAEAGWPDCSSGGGGPSVAPLPTRFACCQRAYSMPHVPARMPSSAVAPPETA